MVCASYNGNLWTTIICYNLINPNNEMDIIIYNKLSSLVRSILKHNVFAIGGDMNA